MVPLKTAVAGDTPGVLLRTQSFIFTMPKWPEHQVCSHDYIYMICLAQAEAQENAWLISVTTSLLVLVKEYHVMEKLSTGTSTAVFSLTTLGSKAQEKKNTNIFQKSFEKGWKYLQEITVNACLHFKYALGNFSYPYK